MSILVLTLFACLSAAIAVAQPAALPDTARTTDSTTDHRIGSTIPDGTLIDHHGEPVRLHSLAGSPVIISPVSTRCADCAIITSHLRDALVAIDGLGSSYHVVTLSVDPVDAVPDLADWHERMHLPAAWKVAIAS
ncbi:MAG: redoxin domain-containing protein, partial [Candidatus Krumholzibacteriota bacterium]|nr:redoxin domain-containing protein [Candidatus Krumholzibacteriota bacterium]